MDPGPTGTQRRLILAEWVGYAAFLAFVLGTAAIVYFDDIQMTRTTAEEVATIYNTRFLGLKGVDLIAVVLAAAAILTSASLGITAMSDALPSSCIENKP